MKKLLLKNLIIICLTIPAIGFTQDNDCNISLPSIAFRGDEISIKNQNLSTLAEVAETIKQHPQCNLRVRGYAESNKVGTQRSWDRVNAIIRYLVERQGISEERFIFDSGNSEGDYNTVDLIATTERGLNTLPAPHPNLRRTLDDKIKKAPNASKISKRNNS